MSGKSQSEGNISDSNEDNKITRLSEAIVREMLKPGDYVFELVIVASQTCKQLTNAARPKIAVEVRRRKNTSIALEEARRRSVPFTTAADADSFIKTKSNGFYAVCASKSDLSLN